MYRDDVEKIADKQGGLKYLQLVEGTIYDDYGKKREGYPFYSKVKKLK